MSQESQDYLPATKHPYPCLLFLLPLLIVYEVGVLSFGGGDAGRTGADTWLRDAVESFGIPAQHWPPVAILVFFAGWTYKRWGDRPKDVLGVLLGMAVEAVIFAIILWGVARGQGPILEKLGIPPLLERFDITLASPGPQGESQLRAAKAVSYLGAGIYEEVIFRLGLFTLLVLGLRKVLPVIIVVPGAMVISSILFSAAHHLGPSADPVVNSVFLFRTLAGIYFCLLYHYRGFGIVAGAHSCYDVLVGVAMT